MYHAHRYCKTGWPGEPEVDPTQDYEESQSVEGWELGPSDCLQLAHQGVLRERNVIAGEHQLVDAFWSWCFTTSAHNDLKVQVPHA
jgi:hypothetical protein